MASFFSRWWNRYPVPRVAPMTEQGTSGTVLSGGAISQIERNPDWIGQQKYRTTAEIAVNVSIVAASVHYFLNLIAHPKWTVKPPNDSAEARVVADFVDEVIHSMEVPWQSVVRRSGSYRFYGFSIQEWVGKKRSDGKIGMRTIEPRPQFSIEEWSLDEKGSVLGMFQRSPQTGQILGLPRGKVVYLVDDTLTDSPEGLGVFRHMAEPYSRLKVYLALEANAFERDLRGIPVGRAPLTRITELINSGKLTEAQADTLIKGMTNFLQTEVKKPNTSFMIDSLPYEQASSDGLKLTATPQWDLSLLTGPALGLTEIAAAINRINREMARITGTEHLMMGDEGGNRALAVDKSRNLYLIANSVLGYAAASYNHDLVIPICELNNIPEELRPKLNPEDVTFKDIDQITGALARMAQAGAVLQPDDPAINDIRELIGISPAPLLTPEQMGAIPNVDTGEDEGDLEEGDEGKGEGEGGAPKPPGNPGDDNSGNLQSKVKKGRRGARSLDKYSEDQERADDGKWTSGGSGSGGGGGSSGRERKAIQDYRTNPGDDQARRKLTSLAQRTTSTGDLLTFHPGEITVYRAGAPGRRGGSWTKVKSQAIRHLSHGATKLVSLKLTQEDPAIDLNRADPGSRYSREREVFVDTRGINRSRFSSIVVKYNEDQARAADGKWGDGGGSSSEQSVGEATARYPGVKADSELDGLRVDSDVPNTGSVSAYYASEDEYTVLPGIRAVSKDDFASKSPKDMFGTKDDIARVESLAAKIKENKFIKPLIVVYDAKSKEEGPWIMEGGHRFAALTLLDQVKQFPAMVVVEH